MDGRPEHLNAKTSSNNYERNRDRFIHIIVHPFRILSAKLKQYSNLCTYLRAEYKSLYVRLLLFPRGIKTKESFAIP